MPRASGPPNRDNMLRAFLVVEFRLGASVRPSLIELSPGQRTVYGYSSIQVWVRRLNLRRLSQNRPANKPVAIPESPTSMETAKFTSTFDLIEQWSEFKAVEFWQPANNNNIGAASVCSSARSVQTSSNSFLPGCACIYSRTIREQEE